MANQASAPARSEEHTSELQSLRHLVCRLLLGKKDRSLCVGARYLLSKLLVCQPASRTPARPAPSARPPPYPNNAPLLSAAVSRFFVDNKWRPSPTPPRSPPRPPSP